MICSKSAEHGLQFRRLSEYCTKHSAEQSKSFVRLAPRVGVRLPAKDDLNGGLVFKDLSNGREPDEVIVVVEVSFRCET